MTAAWDYMKEHILPPLRRVELTIDYKVNSIVEQRTLIPKPKPAPQPAQPRRALCGRRRAGERHYRRDAQRA
ncbi:MAG: hypothetical protein ACLUNS_10255 [Alistipes shahii]